MITITVLKIEDSQQQKTTLLIGSIYISADMASSGDTIDPRFLLSQGITKSLRQNPMN
jgi:hypothetical protein